MKKEFYPALGTPTSSDGTLEKDSFSRQIELMIHAGAKGLLCMGSMGKMVAIKDHEYPVIAAQCCDAANNRTPVIVGVMDCSAGRVLDRIDALGNIDIDGVVATVPFYYVLNSGEIVNYFRLVARSSKYPVYIYDLPGVTQVSITLAQLKLLMEEPNIKGIKTANLNLIRDAYRNGLIDDEHAFSAYCSNLDLFDVALKSGISKHLDGMFTCTPYNSKMMYDENNDDKFECESLRNIIKLRNTFLKENIFSAYTYAMELLNCKGVYHPDYSLPISEGLKDEIIQVMKDIKEI
jgi:4-hydroxy-tetrahydrodipicolinate synthase